MGWECLIVEPLRRDTGGRRQHAFGYVIFDVFFDIPVSKSSMWTASVVVRQRDLQCDARFGIDFEGALITLVQNAGADIDVLTGREHVGNADPKPSQVL